MADVQNSANPSAQKNGGAAADAPRSATDAAARQVKEGARAAEAVADAGRCGDEAASAEDDDLVAGDELHLALEDEEGVGVVVVRVRLDDERLVEGDLDRRDLLRRHADEAVPVAALVALAVSGSADDRSRFGHVPIL